MPDEYTGRLFAFSYVSVSFSWLRFLVWTLVSQSVPPGRHSARAAQAGALDHDEKDLWPSKSWLTDFDSKQFQGAQAVGVLCGAWTNWFAQVLFNSLSSCS